MTADQLEARMIYAHKLGMELYRECPDHGVVIVKTLAEGRLTTEHERMSFYAGYTSVTRRRARNPRGKS